jgi:hypothetical protein
MASDPKRMAEQQRRARELDEQRRQAEAQREVHDDIARIKDLIDENEVLAPSKKPAPVRTPAPAAKRDMHPNLSTPQTRQMGLGPDSARARAARQQQERDLEVPPPPPDELEAPPPPPALGGVDGAPVVKDNDWRLGLEIESDEIETRPRGKGFRAPKTQDRDF